MAGMNRIPGEATIRSNTARGGTARMVPLTPREKEICKELGPHLRANGLVLAGIDVIDGWLTEINVTSPTGLCMIRDIGGPDLIPVLADCVLKKIRKSSC
jgi:glutathione synthase